MFHSTRISAGRVRRVGLFLSLAILLVLTAAPTQAHGYIVRAIPEDRATLERPPTRVQYWFSEALEPNFSTITLLDANGNEIARGGVDPNNTTLMTLRPPASLADGAYVVSLRPAFASDGHVVGETRVFFVGEAIGGGAGQGASDAAVALEGVWRGVVLSSSSLLLGVTALYSLVLVPVWGNKKHIAGFLPPRVITHLTWIAGIALAVALLGNVLALLQNASVLFGQGVGTIIQNGSWNTARIGSRFGDVWNVRMALLVLFGVGLGLTIFWRADKPRTLGPFWQALMWCAALMIATFAVSSHASGSLVMPWVAMLMHWLHMTAVSVWTGGLAALALVVPVALRPYQGDQRRLALLAVTRRFSRLAVGALAITITTGVYNSLNWLFTPSELVETSYGLSLVYKVLLVGGLLAVAAISHVAAHPQRYAWASRFTGGGLLRLRLETVFAAAVLIAAGLVSATPPPTPAFVLDDIPAPRAAQSVDGLQVDMTISPGGLGVNTYDVRVSESDTSLDGATVYVRLVRPLDDVRGVWHTAEQVEPGLYVAAGDEIETVGEWVALVDVVRPAAPTPQRIAFSWDITDDATVLASISPRLQHWAALGGVLLALGWVITPAYRAFLRQMNFDAVTVTLLLLATIGTALVTAVGFWYIGTLQATNDALLNPPPVVVNPTLPDAVSLRHGADQFAAGCGWDTDSRAFGALVERLPRTRDDELYRAVTDGFRELPACDLPPDDAWDVVNHLRTYEPR